MKYYLGAVAFLFGAWLLGQAWLHRRRRLAESDHAPLGAERSLASWALGCAPVVAVGMLLVGLVLVALALLIDTRGELSWVDIAGFGFFVSAAVAAVLLRVQTNLAVRNKDRGNAA